MAQSGPTWLQASPQALVLEVRAPTGAPGPLQLPREVGAGSTPPKIVQSLGGGGAGSRPELLLAWRTDQQ